MSDTKPENAIVIRIGLGGNDFIFRLCHCACKLIAKIIHQRRYDTGHTYTTSLLPGVKRCCKDNLSILPVRIPHQVITR